MIDLLATNLITMIFFLFKKIDAFEMRQQYVVIQHEIILNWIKEVIKTISILLFSTWFWRCGGVSCWCCYWNSCCWLICCCLSLGSWDLFCCHGCFLVGGSRLSGCRRMGGCWLHCCSCRDSCWRWISRSLNCSGMNLKRWLCGRGLFCSSNCLFICRRLQCGSLLCSTSLISF